MRAYVAKVRFELENHAWAVTVPQAHGPGEQAEVDFGGFSAWVAGVLVELWMFCMRLSHSGRGFHLAFANQAQEAFLEGHAGAFDHFGGVPTGHIRYDNLKPAVIKVMLGRQRLENPRFVALRSHYCENDPEGISTSSSGYVSRKVVDIWCEDESGAEKR